MAQTLDYILIAAIGIGAYFVYQKLFPTTAKDPGAIATAGANTRNWAGSVINAGLSPVIGARGFIESGAILPYIPDTPPGQTPSNWSWMLKDGITVAGIPAGMTPRDFCWSTPGAPMCPAILRGG
jgi:hypothetical protein